MKNKKLLIALLALAMSTGTLSACNLFGSDDSTSTDSGNSSIVTPAESITLNKNALALVVGSSETLTANLNGIDGDVEWTSSDLTIATVENGVVTAVAVGNCTITAKCGEYEATCTVNVNDALAITLSETALALFENETATLTATANDGKEYSFVWTSSNPSVATVENGVVTAVAEGAAQIKAEVNGVYAVCDVEVYKEDVYMSLSKANTEINVGATDTITATLSDGSTPEITWTTSDGAVATVENGVITAKQSGTVTITASATVEGETLTANCEVTVKDVYQLIFPELPKEVFVGDVVPLGVILTKNDEAQDISNATIAGEGFTLEDGEITITTSGEITVSVSYEGETREHTIGAYYKVSDKTTLEAIKNNVNGWYKLINDIDLEGGIVETMAHYSAGHNSASGFKGVFDGNNYTISNFYAGYNGAIATNSSLFGWVGTTGVVKNLNLIGVQIKNRIAGGLATANYGTIENCFVEVTVVDYTPTETEPNNPIGGICSKNYGKIENVITVVNIKEGLNTDYIGGIVGFHATGSSLTNCYTVTSVGLTESATPTATGAAMEGTVTDCAKYNTMGELLTAIDVTKFSSDWDFQENSYPHLGEITDTLTINNENNEVYAGATYQLDVTHKLPVVYEVNVEGVTVDANGLVTIADTVEGDTKVVVKVYCVYDYATLKEIELTVRVNRYEVVSNVESITIEKAIIGVTENALGLKVMYNGVEMTEGYTVESDNEAVAKLEGDRLVYMGEGNANVNVKVDGAIIGTIPVTVATAYVPVTSASELSAIAKNLSGKYILMNNIDFEGAEFAAIGTQKVAGSAFTGVFDGNGYSIKNIKPVKSTVANASNDRSIFGYLNGATIKNLSVVGAEIDGFGGVIATLVHNSTIENCYVQVTVTGTETNGGAQGGKYGEEVGALVWRTQAGATIKNCITNVTIAEGLTTQYIGAVVGMHIGTMQNCQAIVTGATFENTYASVHSTTAFKEVTVSAVYASVADFYANVDTSAYNSDVWVLVEGYLPHLNKMTADEVPVVITATNEVYAGNSINVSATNATLTLKETIDGVTLVNGVLTVADTVEGNTVITLVATSKYFAGISKEYTVTVLANSYEVTTGVENITIEKAIIGVTESALDIKVTFNGTEITEGYTIESDNEAVAKVVGNKVVYMGEGNANINVKVDGAIIGTLPIAVNVAYIPVKTAADFIAIGTNNASMAKKYILMNDIDFEGATVNALSSYDSRNTQSFTGVFDGNGYSFKNLKLAQSNVAGSGTDVSLFGYMNNANAVIRNLSVIGVEIDGKGGVLSSWANRGTIENCYVEVTVTGTNNVSSQNDIGAFIWRCQQPITMKNCISVVTVAEGVNTTYVGAVVGMHLGVMENCQAIVVSGNALKVFTSEHATVKGTVTKSAVYTSVADFYANVDKSAYSSDIWVLVDGYLPHLNKLTEAPVAITAAEEIYAGNSINVSATNAMLTLKESIEGVTLVNGVLTVANTVAENTIITLVATSRYFAGVSVEHTVTVLANNYEVTAEKEALTFATGIKGITKQSAGITVSLNGETVTEGYTLGSDNESIVKIVDGEVVMMGVGSANVTVSVNGSVIYNLPVTVSEVYIPVTNASELSAIANNLSGKYILMNDIDFEGAEFASIGTQKVAASAFKGVFDGNGYSIKNIKPVKSAVANASNDRSIFGYLNGATIKNLSVIGAEIDGFGGVIASLIKASTIENCYVQVTVTGTETNGGVQGGKYGEEVGALVWRTQADSTIKNCITNVTIAEGLTTQYIGAVVGMHIGTMQNCQAIVTGATFENTYASVHSTTAFKEVSNSAVYGTIATFYEGVDETTAYDANIWAFDTTNNTIALKKGCSNIKK